MGKISKKLTRKEVLSAVKKDGDVLFSIDKSFWLDAEIVYQSTKEIYDNIDDWEYLAIPNSELEDDKMNGYCVGQVPSRLRKKYAGRAKEIMTSFENAKRV